MRTRQWAVFTTLAASVLWLVSAAAQPFEVLRAAPSTVEGQDQGATREFSISGNHYAFSPANITIDRNDLVKITFTASDMPHSFTLDDYRIVKRAGAGQAVTFEFRADRSGQFPYYCNLTADDKCRNMKGTLTVR